MGMRVGRLVTAVALVAAVAPTTGCKDSAVPVHWADEAITVDGQSSDWRDLTTRYFEEEKIVLGLANDSERLYILFRFGDPQWARSIRMSGLTLRFDPEGGDNTFTLNYNGGPSPEHFRALGPGAEGDGSRQRTTAGIEAGDEPPMRPREPQLQIEIEDRISRMPIASDGSVGPMVAFAMDHGMYCYECSIPLAETEVRYYGLGTAPGAVIGLRAEWGGIPDDRPGRGMGGGMMGGPPGGGTFDGGGPPGGPGGMGGPPGERMLTAEKQDVSLTIVLASGRSETTGD